MEAEKRNIAEPPPLKVKPNSMHASASAGVKKIVGGLTESGLLAREGSKKAGKWVVLK